MEPGHHADPLQEALSQGAQRAAQLASLAAAWAQVAVHRKMLSEASTAADDDRAAQALGRQDRLLREQAAAAWAPATDPDWLAAADLIQAGRAWAAAGSYADSDPLAAAAMRRCEDRLRRIHPYAMARYDRLRSDGASPLAAMRETAPLFAQSPAARPGEPAVTRHALTATRSTDAEPANTCRPDYDNDYLDPAAGQGARIAERIQAQARAAGRPPLDADEMAMILDAATNLPDRIITAISAHAAGLASLVGRSPASIAAESFPHTADEAVRAAGRTAPTPYPQAAIRHAGMAAPSDIVSTGGNLP